MVYQFCRFWIWSDIENSTPAEYGLQHNSHPPPLHLLPATHYLYTLYFDFGRVEGDEPDRRLEFTKLGRKYKQDWLYLQSIDSDKYLPESLFTGQFF